ncbi:spermidine/putrescine ABC transporter substrate-binding protein [bacterium]|nr:spermidine/putrescine ABC transporter substrate-binding protein [bacterium]
MKDAFRILAPSAPACCLSRRSFLGLAAGAMLAACLPGCSGAKQRQLNIYNYSFYINPDTLKAFRDQSGMSVVYDEFSSQDVLFAKLKLGAGYDLVVASDYMLRRLIRQKLVDEIKGFKHYGAMMDMFKEAPWDEMCRFSVPYLWGTTGIAYNKKFVETPPTSWADMWNPHFRGRITMLDEKRDSIGAALILLGYDGNSTDPRHLSEAKEKLLQQKNILRQYTNDYIDGLARSEIWLAQAWSGDVSRAKASNENISYVLPKEGSFYFVDAWCIPKDAEHKDEATEFLNFIMEPKNIAKVTNFTSYPNSIAASMKYVDKRLIDVPLGYPPADLLDRTFPQTDIGSNEKEWDRIWEDIKFRN